jgi:hypothetical protein
MAFRELKAFFVHVSDVLRGKIRVHVINCFEKFVKTCNVGGIKVLRLLRIKASGL